MWETMGKIAGIGGLALGVFLVIFRDFLRQKIFAGLDATLTYKLMRQVLWATWSVAIAGLVLWFLAGNGIQLTFGPNSWILNR
jgi:hypothetical protein